MRKRHREKRPARPKEQRASFPRILVVCEGLITEKEYIEGFARSCRNPRVDVDIHPGIGTPVTIVEYASNILKSFVPNYNKHVDFEHYKNGYMDASRRSQNLDREAILDGDDGRNPTTGVWRLTESISKE